MPKDQYQTVKEVADRLRAAIFNMPEAAGKALAEKLVWKGTAAAFRRANVAGNGAVKAAIVTGGGYAAR